MLFVAIHAINLFNYSVQAPAPRLFLLVLVEKLRYIVLEVVDVLHAYLDILFVLLRLEVELGRLLLDSLDPIAHLHYLRYQF